MSDDKRDTRDVPADLLLLFRRSRRGYAHQGAAVEPPDALLLEPDAIIDEEPRQRSDPGTRIALFRPLSTVMLAGIPWSGAVDHETLQNAIVCSPPRSADRPSAPSWLRAVTTLALRDIPAAEPALYASLGVDDLEALDRLGTRHARTHALALARAAALPETIVGADAATISAAAPSLEAYRRTSLVYAWQAALWGTAPADTSQERDASAVQVVSMLRALLGET